MRMIETSDENIEKKKFPTDKITRGCISSRIPYECYNSFVKNWSKFAFFIAAMLWGVSFAFQKPLLEEVSPYNFTFWNFFVSGVVLLIVAMTKKSNLMYRIKEGFVLGTLLAGMEIFQMVGLKYASAADTAFISNLGMLLIPYFGWVLYRHKVSAFSNATLLLAVVGLYLLVGGPTGFGFGQLMLLLSAASMALYFLYTERFSGERHSHLLVLLVQQFFTTSIICAAIVFFSGDSFSVVEGIRVNFFWQVIAFTALPYMLIQWASRWADEMVAAIYDGVVEPLFGAIGAWVIMVEPTTRESVIGAFIMVTAFAFGSIFSYKHFLRIGMRTLHSFRR